MVTGPQNMPVFSDTQHHARGQARHHRLPQDHRRAGANPGGFALGNLGPVTEGLFVWIFGLGVLIGCAVWLGSKRPEPAHASTTRTRRQDRTPMNEQAPTPAARRRTARRTAPRVRLDRATSGDGGIPERFANPGLPPHVAPDGRHRREGRQARRDAGRHAVRRSRCSARWSSSCRYFAIDLDEHDLRPRHRRRPAPPTSLLGLALGARPARHRRRRGPLGQDPDARREIVEERHPLAAPTRPASGAVAELTAGAEESGIGRRPLIRNTLLGALGLFALPLVVPLRDLGPLPQATALLATTPRGRQGHAPASRDPEHTPIKADGRHDRLGVPRACPRALDELDEHVLEEKAKAAVLLMRLDPDDIKSPEAARLGLRRHRRLLQDLHPRRLPGRPVRAADAPPAVPVPPVDLRRDAGLQGHLRPGRSARCRSCRSPSTPRATSSPPQPSTNPSARASGSVAMSTTAPHRPPTPARRRSPPRTPAAGRNVGGVAGWVDERTGAAKPIGYLLKKVFPDHWSFMLGEIALY